MPPALQSPRIAENIFAGYDNAMRRHYTAQEMAGREQDMEWKAEERQFARQKRQESEDVNAIWNQIDFSLPYIANKDKVRKLPPDKQQAVLAFYAKTPADQRKRLAGVQKASREFIANTFPRIRDEQTYQQVRAMAPQYLAQNGATQEEIQKIMQTSFPPKYDPRTVETLMAMAGYKPDQQQRQPDAPSAVREWEYFKSLSPQEQQKYLAMKRAAKFVNLGGSVVQPSEIAPGTTVAEFQKTLPPQDEPAIIAAQEAARQRAKTEALGEQERAKLEGRGGIPETKKKESAQQQVAKILEDLKNTYAQLDAMGGIVDTKDGALKNIGARIASSGVGQFIGGAVGTEEQSLRNKIFTMRPLLINYIRQASNMGARGLDSEKELEFYLKAATDPTLDIQTNMFAINTLMKAYGPQSVPGTSMQPAHKKTPKDLSDEELQAELKRRLLEDLGGK